jgi:AraC-like DNA-binding protein
MSDPFAGAYQRAGAFAHAAELLREFGVLPEEVGRGLGVDLANLTHDVQFPFSAGLTLLERAAERTGCPHFGLLLGSRYRWRSHGAIHQLASQAPTLRQGLLDFVNWQLGYSSGAVVYLNRIGPDYAFGYGIYDRASPGGIQLYDVCVAVGCDILRELSGGQVAPTEIFFCHDAPDDPEPYRRILKVPLVFNSNQCCLMISGNMIDLPRPHADLEARENVERQIRSAIGLSMGATSVRLRHIIRPQLLKDDPSMNGAANALGLNQRTLRRQLASEGLTFEAVRDQVRYTMARELLDLTDLTIGEISAALAFASQAVFAQAFRRWSGLAPSVWRRAIREA